MKNQQEVFIMKKINAILAVIMASLMVLSLGACSSQVDTASTEGTAPATETVEATLPEGESVSVYTLKGPTGMGMAQLIDEDKDKGDFSFTVAGAPDEITAAIINGDADIAACPVNLASVLYNKTSGGVRILALNTLGVTYLVTNGVEVNSIEDLRGKTIVSAGQGATPEYILTKLLTDSGMEIGKDVFVEYKSEHADVASLVVSGQAQIGLLPEPNVTSVSLQSPNVKVALDLTKEWQNLYGKQLVQGCVIGRADFVAKYPAEVDNFLRNYAESVEFINTATDEAAQMIVAAGIIPKAPVAKKAIPQSYITFIAGDDMKSLTQENLQVLFDANSKSVGGKLPADDFYYAYTG